MLKDLIAVCSVPRLLCDIEDNPIHRDNFAGDYSQVLEINCRTLLDYLSNADSMRELFSEDDCEAALLRQSLVMLMCEHSPITPGGYPPPYTLEDPFVSTNLKRICATNGIISGSTLAPCLAAYKGQLLNSKWRLAIGTSYGFVSFCDLYLNAPDIHVDLQTVLFVLSVASQFIDCIHGEIKHLGLRLYGLILSHCPPQLILDSNVHKVVIKSCLDNAQKLLPDECLILLWDDVTNAICLDGKMGLLGNLNWNEVDDSFQLLFQRIKLEGKREVRAKLRGFLKGIIIQSFGTKEATELINRKADSLEEAQQEINIKSKTKNVKIFRWINDLKELFIFECLSVSNSADSTKEALSFINETYLLTMSGLPVSIIGPTLQDLSVRITPLLLEIYTIYKENAEVTKSIYQLLHMFLLHLDQIFPDNSTHSCHHKALNKLLAEQFLSAPPTLKL